jgi:hypothetical protein
LIKGRQELRVSPVFPNLLIAPGSIKRLTMTYMLIIHGCQAQEAFALSGLISLTFPALRSKPWDLLEIQQPQLFDSCFTLPSLCLYLTMSPDSYYDWNNETFLKRRTLLLSSPLLFVQED